MTVNNQRAYRQPDPNFTARSSARPMESSRRITKNEVYRIYVKSNYEWYEKAFTKFDSDRKFHYSFSFAAFFFGHFWFFYRKMYVEGFILIAVQIIAGILIEYTYDSSRGVGAGFQLVVATWAKFLYWEAVNRKIVRARTLSPQGTRQALSWLEAKGGVNYWIILVALVVEGLLFLTLFTD